MHFDNWGQMIGPESRTLSRFIIAQSIGKPTLYNVHIMPKLAPSPTNNLSSLPIHVIPSPHLISFRPYCLYCFKSSKCEYCWNMQVLVTSPIIGDVLLWVIYSFFYKRISTVSYKTSYIFSVRISTYPAPKGSGMSIWRLSIECSYRVYRVQEYHVYWYIY